MICILVYINQAYTDLVIYVDPDLCWWTYNIWCDFN